MGYVSPKTTPSYSSSPKIQSYSSPKAQAPKVTAYHNGISYEYSTLQKTNVSSCRDLIVEYLELVEKISKVEGLLTELNKQKGQLEYQISNHPESTRILSILSQIDPKQKGRNR